MYDKLIANLRNCAEVNSLSRYKRDLMKQAADVIEELSHELDAMNEANIALHGALPKWIPVEEKLPEKKGFFLTWKDEKPEGFACICRFGKTRWDFKNITHWMKLPEPPAQGFSENGGFSESVKSGGKE